MGDGAARPQGPRAQEPGCGAVGSPAGSCAAAGGGASAAAAAVEVEAEAEVAEASLPT